MIASPCSPFRTRVRVRVRVILSLKHGVISCAQKIDHLQCSTLSNAATAIDLVCVDIATGRLVFVEHKTGDGGGRFHSPSTKQVWSRGCPPSQWHKFDMTPANRAQIQQALGVMMAVRDLALFEVCQVCPNPQRPAVKTCQTCRKHLCSECLRHDLQHKAEWTPVREPFDAYVAHVHERSVDFEPVTHQFMANEGLVLYDYLADPARRAAVKQAKKRKYKNK